MLCNLCTPQKKSNRKAQTCRLPLCVFSHAKKPFLLSLGCYVHPRNLSLLPHEGGPYQDSSLGVHANQHLVMLKNLDHHHNYWENFTKVIKTSILDLFRIFLTLLHFFLPLIQLLLLDSWGLSLYCTSLRSFFLGFGFVWNCWILVKIVCHLLQYWLGSGYCCWIRIVMLLVANTRKKYLISCATWWSWNPTWIVKMWMLNLWPVSNLWCLNKTSSQNIWV